MTVTPAPTVIEGVELFAGPGGWSQGARMARRGLLMLGIEWDQSACATARAAGHPRLLGDVVRWRTVLEVIAMVYLHASPPCQGFSLAGSGKGRKDGERMIRAILSLADGPPDPDRVQQVMDDFDMTAHDHRSVLTMEVLWWIAQGQPTYVSLEQVPGVLRVWEAMATVLRAWGYDVVTGVLRTEQYGVPQTRRRAILLGRKDGRPARMPTPTHSRYYERTPAKLDPDLPRWVSIHEALGWGNDDLVGFPRRYDGRGESVELDGEQYRGRDLRKGHQPSFVVTEKARSWNRFQWQPTHMGDVRNAHGAVRPVDAPSATGRTSR